MAHKRLAPLVLVFAVLGLATGLMAAPGASATVYSFKPLRATHSTVLFAITGVRPDSVRTARVSIENHRPLSVSVNRVRRGARRGHLRLHLGSNELVGGSGPTAMIARRTSRLKIVADTTPPETTITSGPNGSVSSQSASFSFTSSESHSKFQCQRDSGEWNQCSSPKSYSEVGIGTHTFYVRAYDRSGNVDPTPASRSWTVEPKPAETQPAPESPPNGAAMFDGFESANGPNNLITNEYAGWHSWDATAVNSPIWQSDGGSLFSVPTAGPDGSATRAAYTGKLDSNAADKYSETNTHSNKMRFWTKATGYGDVTIEADIKATGWSPEAPSTWAGFKFYLHREQGVTESSFYTVEPYIQNGHVYIQKKCLGDTGGGEYSGGGTYYLLANKSGFSVPLGSWHRIAATAHTNSDGSVTLGLYRDGTLLAQATDHGVAADGTGCAPLGAGHLGFRSDYLQYYLDNFAVSPQS